MPIKGEFQSKLWLVSFILVIVTTSLAVADRAGLVLSPSQLDWVGGRIFQNECASRPECLVHWNEGEAFPSLGIGHFIWYPGGVEAPFVESFPALVQFALEAGEPVPAWLVRLTPMDAPWPDRARFMAAENDTRIASLREWLVDSKGVQAAFILARAQASLGRVIEAAPAEQRPRLAGYLDALTATPGGSYALIDYVNFKGEGLTQSETYQGEGWGLLQVLQQMSRYPERTALDAFRQAAADVLTRRAANASRAIERDRWLPGWLNRLETYREPNS
ncbi:MAG TPA: hypothetical protein VFN16_06550 [Saccharospirillum sp.]|nr:hypothetical protein [Saccharospirillum sp.]